MAKAYGQITLGNISDGTSSYTYIRYSASSDGSSMSEAPTSSTKYVGICITTSSTAPTAAASYVWSLIKGDNGTSPYAITQTQDSMSVPVSSAGVVSAAYSKSSTFIVYQGTTEITTFTLTASSSSSNVVATVSGSTVTVTIAQNAVLSAAQTVTITIVLGGSTLGTKIISVNPSARGADGPSCTLTPSAQFFKSTDGGTVFYPSSITIQASTFGATISGWYRSVDGGVTWTNLNSTASALIISASDTYFTDTVTTATFKVTTSQTGLTASTTIAKLYDIKDVYAKFIGYYLRLNGKYSLASGEEDSETLTDTDNFILSAERSKVTVLASLWKQGTDSAKLLFTCVSQLPSSSSEEIQVEEGARVYLIKQSGDSAEGEYVYKNGDWVLSQVSYRVGVLDGGIVQFEDSEDGYEMIVTADSNCNVTRCGRNLLNIANYYASANGYFLNFRDVFLAKNQSDNLNVSSSAFAENTTGGQIDIVENTSINNTPLVQRLQNWATLFNCVARIYSFTFTGTTGLYAIDFYAQDIIGLFNAGSQEISVELGSTAHPYEPYNGNTYTLTANTPYKIPVLSGCNTVFADNGNIHVEYRKKSTATALDTDIIAPTVTWTSVADPKYRFVWNSEDGNAPYREYEKEDVAQRETVLIRVYQNESDDSDTFLCQGTCVITDAEEIVQLSGALAPNHLYQTLTDDDIYIPDFTTDSLVFSGNLYTSNALDVFSSAQNSVTYSYRLSNLDSYIEISGNDDIFEVLNVSVSTDPDTGEVITAGDNSLKIKRNIMSSEHPLIDIKCDCLYTVNTIQYSHTIYSSVALSYFSQKNKYVVAFDNDHVCLKCDANGVVLSGSAATAIQLYSDSNVISVASVATGNIITTTDGSQIPVTITGVESSEIPVLTTSAATGLKISFNSTSFEENQATLKFLMPTGAAIYKTFSYSKSRATIAAGVTTPAVTIAVSGQSGNLLSVSSAGSVQDTLLSATLSTSSGADSIAWYVKLSSGIFANLGITGSEMTVNDKHAGSVDIQRFWYNDTITFKAVFGSSDVIYDIFSLVKKYDGTYTPLIVVDAPSGTAITEKVESISLIPKVYMGAYDVTGNSEIYCSDSSGAPVTLVDGILTLTSLSILKTEKYTFTATYNDASSQKEITVNDLTDPYSVEIASSNGAGPFGKYSFGSSAGSSSTDLTALVYKNGSLSSDSYLYEWSKRFPSETRYTVISGATANKTKADFSGQPNGIYSYFVKVFKNNLIVCQESIVLTNATDILTSTGTVTLVFNTSGELQSAVAPDRSTSYMEGQMWFYLCQNASTGGITSTEILVYEGNKWKRCSDLNNFYYAYSKSILTKITETADSINLTVSQLGGSLSELTQKSDSLEFKVESHDEDLAKITSTFQIGDDGVAFDRGGPIRTWQTDSRYAVQRKNEDNSWSDVTNFREDGLDTKNGSFDGAISMTDSDNSGDGSMVWKFRISAGTVHFGLSWND